MAALNLPHESSVQPRQEIGQQSLLGCTSRPQQLKNVLAPSKSRNSLGIELRILDLAHGRLRHVAEAIGLTDLTLGERGGGAERGFGAKKERMLSASGGAGHGGARGFVR